MKLRVGEFQVKDVVFGEETSFHDGILTVNEQEAIAALNPDGKLKDVKLHVARPGESVRILPINAIAAPRARADGRATFPGYTGKMASCGEGDLYALEGMAVISVGTHGGWMEGMLDMSGPAADLTEFAHTINLCFTAANVDPSEDDNSQKTNWDYRLGCCLLAEYVAKTVIHQEPDLWREYELTDTTGMGLPRVVMVLEMSTFYENSVGYDDVFYGVDVRCIVPTFVHPNELLDGALCSSSLVCAGVHSYTYNYQKSLVLKKLYEKHGKTLDFVGVILTNIGPNIDNKVRAAIRVATMAQMLKCDGAVYCQLGSGTSDVDFQKTIVALEERGIKCVGINPEFPGRDGTTSLKTALDPRLDAVVSTGSACEVIELPAMERVIGDLQSIPRDKWPGCWADDPIYGPSLRADGTLIVDTDHIVASTESTGWAHKTCQYF